MFNANKMKMQRLANRLTQKELAEFVGLDSSTIGHYEQGSRTPDADILKKIANRLNVSADYLIDNDIKENSYESYFLIAKRFKDKGVSVQTLEKFLDMISELEDHE